jgi:hypothetical protein
VTAVADLISRADRDRLLKRLAEWRHLDGAMRKPGSLAALPPPPPLHKMAAAADSPATGKTPGVRPEPPGGSTKENRRTT